MAEASLYAWEHSDRVRMMDNPAGYLWRVGQSRSRARRRPVVFPPAGQGGMPEVEPKLPEALASLTERQRCCVLLTQAFELQSCTAAWRSALSRRHLHPA